MKKAIFFPPSCSNVKENEFESCRGEGRTIINIAMGFSLLGYECHIINNWNISSPKKIWDNVYIFSNPNENEVYDIAFSYDFINTINRKNYKHKIAMTYAHLIENVTYIKNNNLDVTLVCAIPSFMQDGFTSKNSQYFPPLFPLPSVNIGFIPYKFEPKYPNIKVYLYHSSWEGSSTRSPYYVTKQLMSLDFLKSKGYLPELFIHIENKNMEENVKAIYDLTKYDQNKIHFLYNENIHYDDIIRILKDVDLCITGGAGYDAFGSSVTDMISLGKPFIYIVDGAPRFEPTLNNLYNCPDSLIITQEPYHNSIKKLERIFSNLEESYNCYRRQNSDYDFNNWKVYVEDFLKRNYGL